MPWSLGVDCCPNPRTVFSGRECIEERSTSTRHSWVAVPSAGAPSSFDV